MIHPVTGAWRAGVVRAALCLLALAAAACTYRLDEEQLRARVEASRPTWESYQEEVKAQVGATPVAMWEGSIDEVRAESGRVTVVFRIAEPWSELSVAMPVLLRDPFMNTHAASSVEAGGGRATYVFEVPEASSSGSLAWVEVKYPRGSRRVALSAEGVWRAPLD